MINRRDFVRQVGTAGALSTLDAATVQETNNAGPEMVLVEAEAFDDYGGWILDAQFIDQMGSPYLLSHGLGRPVADAVTTVRFPSTGSYRVFVRTMNWVPGHHPGAFRLLLDGRLLPETFGVQGDRTWRWQAGGTVAVDKAALPLTLRDLEGFDGRCDAILFVKESASAFQPPDSPKDLLAFRRKLLGIPDQPKDAGSFDMIVIGGGFAGICAAIAAARLDLRIALIQNRPILGGNCSSEVRVNPIGKTEFPPFPRNGEIVRDLLHREPERSYSDDLNQTDLKRLQIVRNEKNISLFLDTHVSEVKMDGKRIQSVIALNVRTSQRLSFTAPLFADCTGDATVGYLAGAEYRMCREGRAEFNESLAPEKGDQLMMGNTQYWYARQHYEPSNFPACPWALVIDEEKQWEVPTPRWPMKLIPGIVASAAWNWESGFNKNTIDEVEYIRDHNLRAIFGVWDFLKNKCPDKEKYKNGQLMWAAHVLGKRESRRLMGDLLLTQNDIQNHKVYPDGVATTTWYFDLHYPHPVNTQYWPGEEFRSLAYDDPHWDKYGSKFPGKYIAIEPYPIPFRCFHSRNVPNLMMAGRNISATHAALASARVMQTCGMIGTVVGRAAYLLKKYKSEPRSIYTEHLDEFRRLLENPVLT